MDSARFNAIAERYPDLTIAVLGLPSGAQS